MTPDKFNTVINEIKYADYNEIQQIVEIIRIRKETLASEKINTYEIGDMVEFEHKNKTIKGKISKVKIKRISVKTDKGTWDVPALLLKRTQVF
jgi:hypothetical protein